MQIRLAHAKDALAIAEVGQSLGYAEDVITDLAEQRLLALLGSKQDQIWVAEREDKIVGWLHAQHAFRLASPDFIEILGLSVAEDARQQGIGRALVAEAKNWSHDLAVVLRVRTNQQRVNALAFYSSIGFSCHKQQSVFQWSDNF
ncbi:N-acetyltransferase family protein [Marinomonas sp.]